MAHKAIVAAVTAVKEIPGADNIHVATVLGEDVVVSKNVQVGYVGLFFPVDVQLSEEFCFENSLNRDKEKNKDKEKAGFFDTNRRVRAQPFLKVKSQGYFCGFESVAYTSADTSSFNVGQDFDELNGKKICQKYISEATRQAILKGNKPKQAKVDATPFFEKHVDSVQFKHFADSIPKGALLSFHAKVHGTSHRSGITKARIELPKWKQWINKLAPVFPEWEWKHVVGTRNTVLQDKGKDGFHGSEQFRFDVAASLLPFLKNGMTIYGEIAGYANGKPIMAVHSSKATKDKAFQKKYGENIVYKYGCKEHEYRFHIYRITQLMEDGSTMEYSQKQLEAFCENYGFNAPYEVWPQIIFDGDTDKLRALVEQLVERPEVMCEDYIDPSHPSEGIIIRVDYKGMTPQFYKAKSYPFRVMEGMCEVEDTEDAS